MNSHPYKPRDETSTFGLKDYNTYNWNEEGATALLLHSEKAGSVPPILRVPDRYRFRLDDFLTGRKQSKTKQKGFLWLDLVIHPRSSYLLPLGCNHGMLETMRRSWCAGAYLSPPSPLSSTSCPASVERKHVKYCTTTCFNYAITNGATWTVQEKRH